MEHYHLDLNTSYVIVQHAKASNVTLTKSDLNTSYVIVQP